MSAPTTKFKKPLGISIVSFVRSRSAYHNLGKDGSLPPPGLTCGECSACCKQYSAIDYKDGDDVSLFEGRDGVLLLPLKPGTSECAYLGDQGCTVYARRPATCRSYDCRDMAVTGVTPPSHSGEIHNAVTQWDVRTGIRTKEDAEMLAHLRQARSFISKQLSGDKAEGLAGRTLRLAPKMKMLPECKAVSVPRAINDIGLAEEFIRRMV